MPRFSELEADFVCPFRDGCPYLEGLPTHLVWRRYQTVQGTECQYEHLLQELHQELDQERRANRELLQENQQLKAQLAALHRRQFKGRRQPHRPTHPQARRKSGGLPKAIRPGNVPSPTTLTSSFRWPLPQRVRSVRAPT